MNLEPALDLIKDCAARMTAMYGKAVFNEWAIISFTEKGGQVLYYAGPRSHEEFRDQFDHDAAELRPKLYSHEYQPGDFEFARYNSGTRFEAFLVIGDRVYLICNHVIDSMEAIAKDPKWLNAQAPFLELSDTFRGDPVMIL